jgi:HEAT repeat protein
MFNKLLLVIFLFFSLAYANEIDSARRVEASLLIGDKAFALEEAKAAFAKYPESIPVHKVYIKSLAAVASESEMMIVWEQLYKKAPEEAMQDSLLEEMCFGILQKGCRSNQLPTRLIGLIGCALTQDVRAVQVLRETMHDSNATFRSVAVELGALYRDTSLQEEIETLFLKEKSWDVRQTQYAAIAKLKLVKLKPYLMGQLSKKNVSAEEKEAIIQTLAAFQERIEISELELLAKSSWAPLRALAAKLITDGQLREETDLLETLLQDSHTAVKQAAIESFGILRLKPTPALYALAQSKNPELSILANWAIMLDQPEKGEKGLEAWLEHEKPSVRSLAAGAVAKGGSYGAGLASLGLKTSKDPYVRANCAIALIRERQQVEEACDELYSFLKKHPEPLMWEEGFFKRLQKSNVKHTTLISNYPEAVNQAVRLEILNLLAIVDYPHALDATKEFLKMGKWEVVGLAAENLLDVGDEAAIAMVEKLLQDPDEKIKLQAALLIAAWGGGEGDSITLLLEAYPRQERRQKVKILEALSHLGERKTIPFLINQLKDPSQTLRIIASSVLIQTLNH